MKAIILNSGIGKRMGELTKNRPKSLIMLNGSETILHRQLRLLESYGIRNIIITTGPHREQILNHVEEKFSGLNVEYVYNPLYDKTNYIYSMNLINKDLIDDDILLLHGDLVFEDSILEKLLNSNDLNSVLVNKIISLPEKDFKGRVMQDRVKEISVNIFDSNCYLLMPLYKFNRDDFLSWMNRINKFIEKNKVNVYAEEALNEILDEIILGCTYYENELCGEIDTLEDLAKIERILEVLKQARKTV